MDLTLIKDFTQLGGTVVTVVLFLNYLTKRDSHFTASLKESSDSNISLARALQQLTDTIVVNTSGGNKNTSTISENTGAIEENTNTIKKNGNGNH